MLHESNAKYMEVEKLKIIVATSLRIGLNVNEYFMESSGMAAT